MLKGNEAQARCFSLGFLVDKELRERRRVWVEDAEVASKCKRGEDRFMMSGPALLGTENPRAGWRQTRERGGSKPYAS
jgi:hypothetical protein